MTPRDLASAVRVSFSCGIHSALTYCYSCGRHKWCRGDDPERLICQGCFDIFGHEFPPERTAA